MTIEEIEERQKELRRQINIEESYDFKYDREYVRECWNSWHDLEKIKKILLNSSVDN